MISRTSIKWIQLPKGKDQDEKMDSAGCLVCDREKESEKYCKYHQKAFQNLQESYDEWETAFGKLSFAEYLQKLIENSATGIWVREVAELLLKEEK